MLTVYHTTAVEILQLIPLAQHCIFLSVVKWRNYVNTVIQCFLHPWNHQWLCAGHVVCSTCAVCSSGWRFSAVEDCQFQEAPGCWVIHLQHRLQCIAVNSTKLSSHVQKIMWCFHGLLSHIGLIVCSLHVLHQTNNCWGNALIFLSLFAEHPVSDIIHFSSSSLLYGVDKANENLTCFWHATSLFWYLSNLFKTAGRLFTVTKNTQTHFLP